MGISGILSIICVAIMILSAVALNMVKKKHNNNPQFIREKAEREAAYKRKTMREQTPEEIFDSVDDIYDKDEYSDDNESDS